MDIYYTYHPGSDQKIGEEDIEAVKRDLERLGIGENAISKMKMIISRNWIEFAKHVMSDKPTQERGIRSNDCMYVTIANNAPSHQNQHNRQSLWDRMKSKEELESLHTIS